MAQEKGSVAFIAVMYRHFKRPVSVIKYGKSFDAVSFNNQYQYLCHMIEKFLMHAGIPETEAKNHIWNYLHRETKNINRSRKRFRWLDHCRLCKPGMKQLPVNTPFVLKLLEIEFERLRNQYPDIPVPRLSSDLRTEVIERSYSSLEAFNAALMAGECENMDLADINKYMDPTNRLLEELKNYKDISY